VVELTSASRARKTSDDKKWLYRDVLGVPGYILFDPLGEYPDPSLMGFRLQNGDYVPMLAVSGRLRSEVLGLHFEAHGEDLRLYDPATGRWLPTAFEARALAIQAAAERDQVSAERDQAVADKIRLEQELAQVREF
jgi:hypothetical protein